jgi:hypothetical protein
MRSRWLWPCVVILSCLPLIQANAQGSYDWEVDRGITAYKGYHYEDATEHFSRATEIDPGRIEAHLYLASACAAWHVPGVELKDNLELADETIKEYQVVLKLDPPHDIKIISLTGIAAMYLDLKKWDEARKYYTMASDEAPNNPENYYAIGVIDWQQCYRSRAEAREGLGMRPDQHLSSKNPGQKKICEELRSKNSSTIEDGISQLNKAIDLRPDYDDAMAYLNLMYRERADLNCDDLAAREKDLKTADQWVDKTLAAKKVRAARAASGSESQAKSDDGASNAGQRFPLLGPAPPPPPPPPPPTAPSPQ